MSEQNDYELKSASSRGGETQFEMDRAARNVDHLSAGGLELLEGREPPAYVREPLFPRKVIIGWATATLLVWFAISVIAPIVADSVKTAVKGAMVESAAGTRTITIRTPGGTQTIQIDGPPPPVRAPAPPAAPTASTLPLPVTAPAPEAVTKR